MTSTTQHFTMLQLTYTNMQTTQLLIFLTTLWWCYQMREAKTGQFSLCPRDCSYIVWHNGEAEDAEDTEDKRKRPWVLGERERREDKSTLMLWRNSAACRRATWYKNGHPQKWTFALPSPHTALDMGKVLTICFRLNSLLVKNFRVRTVVDWLCQEESTKRIQQRHYLITVTEAESTSKQCKQLQYSEMGMLESGHRVTVVDWTEIRAILLTILLSVRCRSADCAIEAVL